MRVPATESAVDVEEDAIYFWEDRFWSHDQHFHFIAIKFE